MGWEAMQWPVETRSGVECSVVRGVGLVVTPPRSVLAETSREIDGLLDGWICWYVSSSSGQWRLERAKTYAGVMSHSGDAATASRSKAVIVVTVTTSQDVPSFKAHSGDDGVAPCARRWHSWVEIATVGEAVGWPEAFRPTVSPR